MWQELSENLSSLATLFRSESFFPQFQSFLKRLYARQMSILGWANKPDEESRTATLRATVIGMMGISGDKDVLSKAFDTLVAYKKEPVGAPIPGDVQRTIFRCALRHNEAAVFYTLREIFESESSLPEEKRSCLYVMGCVKDMTRHQEMIEYVLWSGKVRLQDISFPLATLSGTTDEGGYAMWDYFRTNFYRLRERLSTGPMWGSLVALSCRGIVTTRDADDVETFFADPARAPGSAKRRLTQTLELVRTRCSRRERDREGVAAFFSQ